MPTTPSPGSPQSRGAFHPLVRFAPALFILIWASGYVVAKFAAPHAEPLTFLLWRYLGTVVMMFGLAVVAGARWPGRSDVVHLAVAGVAMQAGYLGGVWVAISQGMPAGISALIVNLQPVLTAALAFLVHERVSKRQWLGVTLGFGGVVLVVWQKLTSATTPLLLPTLLCLFALLSMTGGTLYQKRHVPQFDLRAGQVIQAIASIAVTLPFVLAFESFRIDWNASVILAMLWSVLVLTGGGISLMFMMLRQGRATTVTSYMYLVPAVTAMMAWAMFGESLPPLALLGMAVTLAGIWLVAGGQGRKPSPDPGQPASRARFPRR
jgi:drug/metabolite transporter (DMT)-like permease